MENDHVRLGTLNNSFEDALHAPAVSAYCVLECAPSMAVLSIPALLIRQVKKDFPCLS